MSKVCGDCDSELMCARVRIVTVRGVSYAQQFSRCEDCGGEWVDLEQGLINDQAFRYAEVMHVLADVNELDREPQP